MMLMEPLEVIIARIEAKYKKCKTCGRTGVRKGGNHICFYCGDKDNGA